MDERRGARRFQMSLPVQVTLPAEGRRTAATAQTRDVSFRGLYIMLEREFAVGAPIEFVLTLPKELTLSGDVRVQCMGRVVRVEKIEPQEPRPGNGSGGRVGVAAVIDQYEFLPLLS